MVPPVNEKRLLDNQNTCVPGWRWQPQSKTEMLCCILCRLVSKMHKNAANNIVLQKVEMFAPESIVLGFYSLIGKVIAEWAKALAPVLEPDGWSSGMSSFKEASIVSQASITTFVVL
jgi:hypothetical protein